MNKVETLVEILRRLNRGENPEKVRQEARDFIAEVGPEELSRAEQQLLEEGLESSELAELCEIHMEVLGDHIQDMKAEVPPGHVIHTLVSEHDEILDFLSELDEINDRVQGMERYEPEESDLFHRLHHIAEHLVETEAHHEREEEVLFPEMEQRGITGPPRVMRQEHVQLRGQKADLLELSESVEEMDFAEFQRRLNLTVFFIVPVLCDHIFKENNILYPAALEVIEDEEVWERMRDDCDEIGYCCFTPGQESA
jgi:hypothetical protein